MKKHLHKETRNRKLYSNNTAFQKKPLVKQKHITKNVDKYNFINKRLKIIYVRKHILQHEIEHSGTNNENKIVKQRSPGIERICRIMWVEMKTEVQRVFHISAIQ